MNQFQTLDDLLETLNLLVANSLGGWSATINCGQVYKNLTFNSTQFDCLTISKQEDIPEEGGFLSFEDLTKTLETIKSSFDKKSVSITPTISARNKYPHLTVQLTQMKELRCFAEDCLDEDCYRIEGNTFVVQPSLFNKLYKFIVPDYYFCQQVFRAALLVPLVVLPTSILIKKLGLKV